MSVVEKAQTAVQHPNRVPPYLRRKASVVPRRLATRWRTRGLGDQRAMLEWLRGQEDWLLIVLDACRYDMLAEQFGQFFEGSVSPIRSAGHDTFEYVSECWDGQHDVTYLSGATPINSIAHEYEDDHIQALYDGYTPADHIAEIVDVWESAWDESLGTCPPWAVTDAAFDRRGESGLVAHYFQPHAPYIGEREQLLGHTNSEDAKPYSGAPVDSPIWQGVRSGAVSDEQLRDAYRANLTAALREVARLVAGVDRDHVIIMGDHGEALGEWGVYAHPRKAHPHIRRIPWARVDGLTEHGREVADSAGREAPAKGTTADVSERLAALGYR